MLWVVHGYSAYEALVVALRESGGKSSGRLRHVFVYVYLLLYLLSILVLYIYDRKIPLEVGWLWVVTAAVAVTVLLWTRRWQRFPEPDIEPDRRVLMISAAYVALYILLTSVFWKQLFGRSILIYQFLTLWLLLVAAPALLLKLLGRRLPALGFRSGTWRRDLVLAMVVSLALSPLLIALSPLGRLVVTGKLSLRLIGAFPLVLVFALLTAAFQEEFFFRGILQDAAQGFFGSEVNAIAFAVIIFSLFHFPFVYYEPIVQQKGVFYGLALTFFTKGTSGIAFGLLWSRTRGLVAPAFVHAWLNALPNLTQFRM